MGGGAPCEQPRNHHLGHQPQAGSLHLRLQGLHRTGEALEASHWVCGAPDYAAQVSCSVPAIGTEPLDGLSVHILETKMQ